MSGASSESEASVAASDEGRRPPVRTKPRSASAKRVRRTPAQYLERRLRKFSKLDQCVHLAKGLFGKKPELMDQFNEMLEAVNPATAQYQLHAARRFITRVALDAAAGRVPELPDRLDAFLGFMDLSLLGFTAENSARKWHVFGLQNYDAELSERVQTEKLRKRLKYRLPNNEYLTSVQLDVQSINEGRDHRAFFRVAMVRKSKSGKGDEVRLRDKAPTFISYYVGEPYFYVDRYEPDPKIAQALCECLFSTDYMKIPLSGAHLESLRQLRLNRDGKQQKTLGLTSNATPFDIMCQRPQSRGSLPYSLPILDKLTVKCNANARHNARDRNSLNGSGSNRSLDLELSIEGKDVLNSLQALATSKTAAIFKQPLPIWVQDAANRGRSVITLRPRSDVNMSHPQDDDSASVAASEMTVLMRKL